MPISPPFRGSWTVQTRTSTWWAELGARWRESTWRRPATRCRWSIHYTISRDEARDLTGVIAGAGRRALERMPGLSRRRIDDLPFAAVTLRRVLRASGVRRVVFSASGLREGWFMQRMPEAIRTQDPLLAAGQDYARRLGRDTDLPPALVAWTDPLFSPEPAEARRLREAACWMSDIGSHDHPEFRAGAGLLRVLRQPGIGLDHHARAFLAMAIAMRYEVDTDAMFLRPARLLLDVSSTGTGRRCWALHCALPTRCARARRIYWPARVCDCRAAA